MKLPKSIIQLAILLILSILATGCKKTKESEPVSPVPTPAEVNLLISDVTYNSVKINYSIQSTGPETITEIGICWDTLPNPTIEKNKISSTTISLTTHFFISDLNKTSYFFAAYLRTASGIKYFNETPVFLPRIWTKGSQALNGKITCIADWGGIYKYMGTDNNGLFELNLLSEVWTHHLQNPKNIQSLISNTDFGHNDVFVATPEGLFKNNYSGTWDVINSGLKSLNATKLAKSVHGDVFVLTDGQPYVWRDNWKEIPLPASLTINTMWTGSYGILVYDKPAGKIYRMNDGKDTFSLDYKFPLLCTAPAADILTIAILNDRLYLGSTTGAFISSDDGQSWTEVNDPLVKGHRVSAFIKDPYGICAVVENEVLRVSETQLWSVLCPGLPKDKGFIAGITRGIGLYVFFINGTTTDFYQL